MPLDSAWVDQIHARLLVRYGSHWRAMFAGIDPDAVKADWAQSLAGMTAAAIRYALDNLPEDRPPTVAVFKRLCLQGLERPDPYTPRLTMKGDPMPPAVAEKLKALRAQLTGKEPA